MINDKISNQINFKYNEKKKQFKRKMMKIKMS